ncbi:MAG: response regulator [Dehalococcoidia bacterium]
MTTIEYGRPVEILLVEDNPGDVILTQEALYEAKIRNNLNVAVDGVEALEYLRHEGAFANAVEPDVILMDLNMPRMGGREVLEEVEEDPALKHIPVFILTSSASERDIVESHKLHANCYITKPADLTQFLTVVRSIENFWLTVVRLPNERWFNGQYPSAGVARRG